MYELHIKQSLTYFLVKFEENALDLADFAAVLGLDLSTLERFGTECTLEIGRNELYEDDINDMLRFTLKDLFGKEEQLVMLKEKYRLEYSLERVPVLDPNRTDNQRLSLADDILAFMHRTGTHDDLDYFIWS